MSSELKQCPFCGGDGSLKRIYGIGGFAFVECLSCGAIGEAKEGDAEAVNAWNKRAERTCKVKSAYVDEREMYYECSVCGLTDYVLRGEATFFDYEYCPNCGSRVVGD